VEVLHIQRARIECVKEYDVIIVGGGIAGSITAKYAAQGGLKTLLIE
jgi:flavin-dependent dehydrogenase